MASRRRTQRIAEQHCPACGNETNLHDNFCTSCGSVVKPSRPTVDPRRNPNQPAALGDGGSTAEGDPPAHGPRWAKFVGVLGVVALLAGLILQFTRTDSSDGPQSATAATSASGNSAADCDLGNPLTGVERSPDLPPPPSGTNWELVSYNDDVQFYRTCGTSDALARAILESSADDGTGSLEDNSATPMVQMFNGGYEIRDPDTNVSHKITCRSIDADWVECNDGESGLGSIGTVAALSFYPNNGL